MISRNRSPKQAGRAIEGGVDHFVELQVGPQLGFVEIEALFAHFLREVAPVPRRDGSILALCPGVFRECIALFRCAADGFGPHSRHQFVNVFRLLRHRIFEVELGERFEAHELGVLAAQSDDFRNDAPIICIAITGATRDPGFERLLA